MSKNKSKVSLQRALAILLLIAAAMTGCKQTPAGGDQEVTGTSGVKEQYEVTFYSDDGTVLKIDSVAENTAAEPPVRPQMSYGKIFKSWDTDISNVTEAVAVRPVCEDLESRPNVFAVTSTYGKSAQTVTVPIQLCGEVCLSGFEITVSYDAQKLELVSVLEDGGVIYNDEVPGQLQINYVSIENTLADVDICNLEFAIKASEGEVPVTVVVNSIYACEATVDSENDALYTPQWSVINGAVYVLPQGEDGH